MIRTAICCCGASAIELEGEPTLSAVCSCDSCKRRTGSAFGWSVYFADGQVRSTRGELRAYEIVEGSQQIRSFCGRCGTTLFWKTSRRPNETGVAGGCLEAAPPPRLAASDTSRVSWFQPPPDLRRYP